MGAQNYDPLGCALQFHGLRCRRRHKLRDSAHRGRCRAGEADTSGLHGSAGEVSALVNTASATVATDDSGIPVNVVDTGAGQIAADAAIQSTVTLIPPTISFGSFAPGSPLAQSQTVTVNNTGAGAVNLSFPVQTTNAAAGTV